VYCTLDDIKQQISETTLIEITDDNQANEINTTIVDEAILYSGTLIDGFLRGRYSIPLPIIPVLIKIISADLSVFRLYSRRFHTDMPESINNKYKNCIKLLEQIQKGIVSLGIEKPEDPPECGEYITNKTFRDRIFTDSVLDTM
jgi:phage gp36-like protein